jgi:hypothetical protein
MWHQDLLNQELSNLNNKVILCQKIVRGYLCRKRLVFILDRVHKTKEERLKFIQQIHLNSKLTKEKQMDQLNHRNQQKHKINHQYNAPPAPPPPPPLHQAAQTSMPLTKNITASSNKDIYKLQNLKNKIENQMKSYAKQEDYEEMLKLVKVNINLEFFLFSFKTWMNSI